MQVASSIGRRIVSAALMQHTLNCVVRWQDQWLTARGGWHCSPSLCWCAGATASRTPISTAALSQPWSSSMFWSPPSKAGIGRDRGIFGGQGTGMGLPVMIQARHLLRMYCMKNSDTVGQKKTITLLRKIQRIRRRLCNISALCWFYIMGMLSSNKHLHISYHVNVAWSCLPFAVCGFEM